MKAILTIGKMKIEGTLNSVDDMFGCANAEFETHLDEIIIKDIGHKYILRDCAIDINIRAEKGSIETV